LPFFFGPATAEEREEKREIVVERNTKDKREAMVFFFVFVLSSQRISLSFLPLFSGGGPEEEGKRAITQADRVSVYLALAQAYARAAGAGGEPGDAGRGAEFSGTARKVRYVGLGKGRG